MSSFTPEQVQEAIDGIAKNDGKKALEILTALLVAAASEATGEPPPPADAGATQANAETPPPKPGEEQPAEMAALSRGVCALFVGKTPGAVLESIRVLKLAADKVETDRAALEVSERLDLVTELVTLGVEFPATAWKDVDKTGNEREPVARLAAEPIADLRARVGVVRASKGIKTGTAAPGAKPPASEGATPPGPELTEKDLDSAELSTANSIKDPAKRAKFVELRLSKKVKV